MEDMSRWTRGGLAGWMALALAATLGGPHPAAHGEPEWAEGRVLATGSIDPESISFREPRIAAWLETDGGVSRVRATRGLNGLSWSAPVFLSTAGRQAEAVSTGGYYGATVVWREYDGTHWLVRASVRIYPNTWSAPVTVSTATTDADDPAVVGEDPEDRASTGEELVVWRELDSAGHWLVRKRWITSEGKRSSAAETLSKAGQDARDLRVGPGGIAWTRFDGSHWRAQVASYACCLYTLPARTVSPIGEDAYEPEMPRYGTTVWRTNDGHWRVRAAEMVFFDQGVWGASVFLSPAGTDAEDVSRGRGPRQSDGIFVVKTPVAKS